MESSFPECRKCNDGVLLPLGLRARWGADQLQGLGLQQSGLRVQRPDRQRRDQSGENHRAVDQITARD